MNVISFSCSSCGQGLKVAADKAGKKVKCTKCGSVVTIPAAEEESDLNEMEPAPVRSAAPVARRNADRQPVQTRDTEKTFAFDGGAGSFFVTGLLAYFLTLFTLGIGFPWAMCMFLRWQMEHTMIEGRRLRFNGTGGQLLGRWILWFFLQIITLGLYAFWVIPAFQRWIVENTDFADA